MPADIEGLGQAVEPWQEFIAMFDRESLLWAFAAVSMAYIFWMDVRPWVEKWKARKAEVLKVHNWVRWDTSFPQTINGETYFLNVCYLIVFNDSKPGKTVRSVRVKAGVMNLHQCKDRDTGDIQVDLHTGETALFELGAVVSKRMFGFTTQRVVFSEVDAFEAEHNVSRGYLTFMQPDNSGISLTYPEIQNSANPLDIFLLRVSAEGHPFLDVKLLFDASDIFNDSKNLPRPIRTKHLL